MTYWFVLFGIEPSEWINRGRIQKDWENRGISGHNIFAGFWAFPWNEIKRGEKGKQSNQLEVPIHFYPHRGHWKGDEFKTRFIKKMDCHPGNKHRPCQIRVGRIVSTKDLLFLGSMSKYQRINAKIHELMPINEGVSARRIGNVAVGQEPWNLSSLH